MRVAHFVPRVAFAIVVGMVAGGCASEVTPGAPDDVPIVDDRTTPDAVLPDAVIPDTGLPDMVVPDTGVDVIPMIDVPTVDVPTVDVPVVDVPLFDVPPPRDIVDVPITLDVPPPRDVVDVIVPTDAGVCTAPIDLNAVGTVTGLTTRYVSNNSSAPATALFTPMGTMCISFTGAQVAFTYTPTVAGELRISTVDAATTFDTFLVVITACSPAATQLGCNDDAAGSGGVQSQLTTALLPAGVPVTILVGGFGGTNPARGTFALDVTEIPVVPPGGGCDPTGTDNLCITGTRCVAGAMGTTCEPYEETTIPVACDDLSAAPVLTAVVGDDASSAVIPLPTGFAFSYFSAPVDHYSACTNGFLQLWNGGGGVPSIAFGNRAIPGTSLPASLVAPFWTDLYVGSPGLVHATTFGTAPDRRFVVEWQHDALLANRTAALTFQVKLFETTNVIEFHYCSMLPASDGRTTGATATIGLANASGMLGVQHSFNTAMSVGTATALRFSP